jgi:D-galactose 1-dehydrogenase
MRGHLKLSAGGAKLEIGDKIVKQGSDHEYANLYKRMASLIRSGKSDMDLSPMVHVSDAFTLGKRKTVDAFHF